MNASCPSSCTFAQNTSNFGAERLSPFTCPPMATPRAPNRLTASSMICAASSGNCCGIDANLVHHREAIVEPRAGGAILLVRRPLDDVAERHVPVGVHVNDSDPL